MSFRYQIIYWRDIPAQIKIKQGRRRLSRELPARFPVAIDEAAMRAGLTTSDDYLEEWRRSPWQERSGEPDEQLEILAAEVESAYTPERLRRLINQFGKEGP